MNKIKRQTKSTATGGLCTNDECLNDRRPFKSTCLQCAAAEAENNRRAKHRAAGLCERCNNPPTPGKTKCAKCRAQMTANLRRWRASQKEQRMAA